MYCNANAMTVGLDCPNGYAAGGGVDGTVVATILAVPVMVASFVVVATTVISAIA